MRSSGAEKVFFGYGTPLLSLGSQLDFLIIVPGERFERYAQRYVIPCPIPCHYTAGQVAICAMRL